MVQRTPHPFTVEDFDRMIETGILGKDDRVELLAGEVVEMSPIGPFHNSVVQRLIAHFAPLVPTRVILNVQGPIWLSKLSQPQPDLTLLAPRRDFYKGGHATPTDVLLLIEVADTSVQYDRQAKLPRYAEAGVAEVWLVDVATESVSVHRDPVGETYQHITRHAGDATIAPAAFADRALRVAALFE